MFPLAFVPPAPIRTEEGSLAGDRPASRVRLVNAALAGAWRRGWAMRPTLEPEQLIRKAAIRAASGPDANAGKWRERLDLLCLDLEHEARLTELGRTIAHGQIVAALANRFRAHALWRRHPEILEQPISAPIVVLGQMRSGSTRMQRLLACDRQFTSTRFYESWNPVPERDRFGLIDDRKIRGWFGLFCARLLNPHFDALHPTAWNAVDEEIGLHNLSIFGSAFEAQWRVPNFTAAVEQADSVPVYLEFKRLLQTLAWLRRTPPGRPWILKVPQFTQDLPALLQVFPDARLVCLHRDHDRVVASSAALVRNQMELQSDAIDPQWITTEWVRKVRLRARRVATARAETRAMQVDVDYDDVTADWAGEVKRVYAVLNLSPSPGAIDRMRAYIRCAKREARSTRSGADSRMAAVATNATPIMALTYQK